nr:MAG TPA: hypothetical protein [Caudoviricetes sp.]
MCRFSAHCPYGSDNLIFLCLIILHFFHCVHAFHKDFLALCNLKCNPDVT